MIVHNARVGLEEIEVLIVDEAFLVKLKLPLSVLMTVAISSVLFFVLKLLVLSRLNEPKESHVVDLLH